MTPRYGGYPAKYQRAGKVKRRAQPSRRALLVLVLLAVFAAALKVGVTRAVFSDWEGIRVYLQAGAWNNCTYTQGYWKNHPDVWHVQEIAIGNETYTKEEAIAILETPIGGDATYILAHQLIPAKLNVLQGADPSAVETTTADADEWLIEHPLGSDPSDPDREQGISLAETLDNYNNGVIGPGHCED